VPEISRFYGIVITMNRDDHPPPHFHARYAGKKILVAISDGTTIGDLPQRQLALIERWRKLHLAELLENWRRAGTIVEDLIRIRALE
jgi:hypothetical protein